MSTLSQAMDALAATIDDDREAGDPDGLVSGMEAAYRLLAVLDVRMASETAQKAVRGPETPDLAPEPLPVLSGLYGLPGALPSLLSVVAQQALQGRPGRYVVKVWPLHDDPTKEAS